MAVLELGLTLRPVGVSGGEPTAKEILPKVNAPKARIKAAIMLFLALLTVVFMVYSFL
jgi:hypothetical protein